MLENPDDVVSRLKSLDLVRLMRHAQEFNEPVFSAAVCFYEISIPMTGWMREALMVDPDTSPTTNFEVWMLSALLSSIDPTFFNGMTEHQVDINSKG